MKKAEMKKVRDFREQYKEYSKNKSDKAILTTIRYVESVRKELRSQLQMYSRFIEAASSHIENELVLASKSKQIKKEDF